MCKFRHFQVEVTLALCRWDTDLIDKKTLVQENVSHPEGLLAHVIYPEGVTVPGPLEVSKNGTFYTTTVDYFLPSPIDASVLREELDDRIEHWLWAGSSAYVITRFHILRQDNRRKK